MPSWLEAKKEAEQNRQQFEQQNNQPEPSKAPSEIAELRREIAELKASVESLSKSEIKGLNDNFNYIVDDMCPQLEEAIIGEISPMIANLKQEIQKLDVNVNSAREKVTFFFWISGFKEFLFWLSIVCNVGLAGYVIYSLIDWSKIIG